MSTTESSLPVSSAIAPVDGRPGTSRLVGAPVCATPSPFGIFEECPHCGGSMAPEHAHFRCRGCGWRDSCCD